MSYLVLARKWRPTTFSEVTGQDHVIRTLVNAIKMNRVAHSFLFTGARGVGKTSTARILAKALNCTAGPTPEPCGTCASCTEIPDGRSMDVLEIDGASNRGIGEIRELRDGVRYAPSRDKYKVYIIDEVHMLTQEAFNALLKTLEEPPSHVVFIFATTEPQKIPVTILSRCQRFDFKRVAARTLIGRLQTILEAEGITLDEPALHLVARESEGSVRDALSLLDRIIAAGGNEITAEDVSGILGVADRRWLHHLVHAVFSQDPARALKVIHELNNYGYDNKHFVRELVHFLRDLLVIRLGTDAAEEVTDLASSEFESMTQLVQHRTPEDLERLLKIGIKGVEEIAHAPFPKIALEMMVVRMASLRPLRPMGDLIARLALLEKALPEGAIVPALEVPQAVAPAAPALPIPSPPAIPEKKAESVSPPSEPVTPTPPVSAPEEVQASPSIPAAPVEEPVSAEPAAVETSVEASAPAVDPTPPAAPQEAVEEPGLRLVAPAEPNDELGEVQPPVAETGSLNLEPQSEPAGDPTQTSMEMAEPVEPALEVAELVEDIVEPPVEVVEPIEAAEEEPAPVEEAPAPSFPENAYPSSGGNQALEAFLAAAKEFDPALAGELAQAKVVLEPGVLRLLFRSSLFTGRFAEGQSVRERLDVALGLFFSDTLAIEVGRLEQESPDETRYETHDRERKEHIAQRKSDARQDPLVQQVAMAFSGEVTQISLLGDDANE